MERPGIMFLTPHSRQRASQRGISHKMIEYTILYGQVTFKQGLRFFMLKKRGLEKAFGRDFPESLNGTVVVLSPYDEIVTVYKNRHASGQIRKKTKRLFK